MTIDREDCAALDEADPLAPYRARFATGDEGIIYLDANSLGPLPADAQDRLERVIGALWAEGRSQSWSDPRWIEAPARIGAKIARLVGARPDEVIVGDGTSVNLYKVLTAALSLAPAGRRVILSERDNFPSDLHIAQGIVALSEGKYELKMIEAGDNMLDEIDENVAVVTLTHASFRTGACHDMAAVNRRAREAGALVVWDLSHSAGAREVDLEGSKTDFAVGCGYKYLGGGPGSPAFVYVRKKHQGAAPNPLSGWMSHADTMSFETDYHPAEGVRRFLCGSPEVLALGVLEAALDVWEGIEPGLVFEKNRKLTGLFMDLVEQELAPLGISVITPRAPEHRGGQVTLAHDEGEEITRQLVAAGVYCTYRPPNAMRFGFQPFCLRYIDVWEAIVRLRALVEKI